MITGYLLQVLYAVVVFMVSLLPTLALPSGFTSAITTAVGYMNEFSFLLPVSALLTVVGLALAFHLAILTFDFTLWVVHLLRGR